MSCLRADKQLKALVCLQQHTQTHCSLQAAEKGDTKPNSDSKLRLVLQCPAARTLLVFSTPTSQLSLSLADVYRVLL